MSDRQGGYECFMLISFTCHVTSTHWEILVLKQKVPLRDILTEGERDGSELTKRSTATEHTPSAPDWLSHIPAGLPQELRLLISNKS